MSKITYSRAVARQSLHALGRKLSALAAIGGGPIRGGLKLKAGASAVLAGQCVLVTGASSGIGRALALKLGAAGAKLVLVARSADKLNALRAEIAAGGGEARCYPADLSSPSSVSALLQSLQADAIAVDVLVNNAGRSIRRSLAEAYDRAHDYERTMAINYFGAVRLSLGVLPGMRARGYGQIVNVSSAGVQHSLPLFSAYVASKAALDAFARVAANEVRSEGVSFSTVHMPLVDTPMIAPTAEYRQVPALSPEEAADLVLRAIITRAPQLGTWLGSAVTLAYAIAPQLTERWLSCSHTAEPRSAARAEGDHGRTDQAQRRAAQVPTIRHALLDKPAP
jgi:short-subunit dehydrogenase